MLKIKKAEEKFLPDCSRVIIKPHIPGDKTQVKQIIGRVLSLSEEQVEKTLNRVVVNFADRHKNIWDYFEQNFNKVKSLIPNFESLSNNRKALVGAYFSCEYSIQAAAFFNPSIVPHPNQEGVKEGSLRFIMSFRSVGEGHISSIEFRSGIVDDCCNFKFDPVSKYAQRSEISESQVYNKDNFFMKLKEMFGYGNQNIEIICSLLPEKFNFITLLSAIQMVIGSEHNEMAENIIWLAKSNYELSFKSNCELSEKVIFPASQNDVNGIEDARFVRFIEDDGEVTYYATYTAYDGYNILPQLIETKDFSTFKVMTLCGKFSRNKGMALFPRKINGKYMMISRVDGENLYIMSSDNLLCWNEAKLLKMPENDWEFVQIGNCGSPIETDKGWILLTHGVGPVREYSIGVALLDIDNPKQIIGNISEPLIRCVKEEREGYVPNVVYSCGSMVHNNNLIIPYAMSDICSGIATITLEDLFENLDKLEKGKRHAYDLPKEMQKS